ncbi:MAG TPA: Gfo/Idh/MocA family oxidoreductase [Syntrophales bacterium]|nr:Gfo/Idh/MocA family oxidoreductase [Syntrophales bacterium]HRT62180.1 Gfo/Idh/MocA family oxidoreductase [Syntrophales bacterium]
MKRIKVGVVGIGHLGNYHLQKYKLLPDVEIAGVADTLQDRSRKAAALYGCTAFSDHREMIGSVDAVSVTVPTRAHHAVAKDFLSAGKDVLLEKPIAVTLEEADALIGLSEEKGALLQIGFVERFNPAVTALGKVIEKPMFVESHRLHPFIERGTDVDVVLDLMIHDLDIILHFVRSPVKNVEAVGVSVLSDEVDIANVRIVFENGCVANITASRITLKNLQKIRFFGLEGYHSVDFEKRELVSLSKTQGIDGKVRIAYNDVEVIPCDPLEEEIRAFVHSVKTRKPPPVSGREGRKALELAVDIVRKMKTGKDLMP